MTRSTEEHEELMVTVAELYHCEGLGQTEVAEAVRVCPTVIGVVTGDSKEAVTLAAVKAGLITVLATDSRIAEHLVSSHDSVAVPPTSS